MYRNIYNGELRISDVNKEVELVGWVAKKRNLGSLTFIDLRDRTGIAQIVFKEEYADFAAKLRNEYVIHVFGKVIERESKNLNIPTGEVEVLVSKCEIVTEAETTPLIIADETDALEDTRLKYRYLDLRRPCMQQKIIMRSKITGVMRNFLEDEGFINVETPVLGKSTPEGARDYLVPSRVHPGEFYALPQSPQLFKQLLMIAGFEKYYQVARCFRDEDLRADRQPDFTQVDIEASFMSEEELRRMTERMLQKVMKEVKGIDIAIPFKEMTWNEAMNRFGSDKPDVRFGYELQDITELFLNSEFKVFKGTIESNGKIKAIVVDDKASMSRKEIDKTTELAKKYGAKGLVTLKYVGGAIEGSAAKFLSDEEKTALISRLELKENDMVFIVSDSWKVCSDVLGFLRCYFAKEKGLINKSEFAFLWVIDFPLLEWSEEDNRFYAMHHPFTMPKKEDLPLLDTDPGKVRAAAYDVVLNGYELGGGSLRIFDTKLQEKMFNVLGFTDEQIRENFGFFVDAFKYGTPPHGGLALGLDRVCMILSESDNLRDVIAFPKNAAAKCPMSDAPSKVTLDQLKELSIKIEK